MSAVLNAAERAAAVARVERARELLTDDVEPYAAAALQVLLDRTVPELLECIDALEVDQAQRADVVDVSLARVRAQMRVEVLDELAQWAVHRWGPCIVLEEISARRVAQRRTSAGLSARTSAEMSIRAGRGELGGRCAAVWRSCGVCFT